MSLNALYTPSHQVVHGIVHQTNYRGPNCRNGTNPRYRNSTQENSAPRDSSRTIALIFSSTKLQNRSSTFTYRLDSVEDPAKTLGTRVRGDQPFRISLVLYTATQGLEADQHSLIGTSRPTPVIDMFLSRGIFRKRPSRCARSRLSERKWKE